MSATGALLRRVGLDDVLIDGVGQVVVVRMAALLELFQFSKQMNMSASVSAVRLWAGWAVRRVVHAVHRFHGGQTEGARFASR